MSDPHDQPLPGLDAPPDVGVTAWLRRLAEGQDLGPAQRRVYSVLATQPRAVAFESVRAVAARAGTDPAAVVRLSRALGFAGWPELRSAVAAQILAGAGGGERPRRAARRPAPRPAPAIGDARDGAADGPARAGAADTPAGAEGSEGAAGAPGGGAPERVGDAVWRALDSDRLNLIQAAGQLDTAHLARAVEMLLRARRVIVHGSGTAEAAVSAFVVLGRAMGLNLERPRTGVDLAIALTHAEPGDLLMVLTLYEAFTPADRAMALCRERGIEVLLLTDDARDPAAAEASLVLEVPSEGVSFLHSTTALVSVSQGLLYGVEVCTGQSTIRDRFETESVARRLGVMRA